MMYIVATRGNIFNWANILAATLRDDIIAEKLPDVEKTEKIYMGSYMCDVICSRCQFDHWIYHWNVEVKDPIHQHLKLFSNTCYKNAHESISYSFITPL